MQDIVIDTSVFVAALRSRRGASYRLLGNGWRRSLADAPVSIVDRVMPARPAQHVHDVIDGRIGNPRLIRPSPSDGLILKREGDRFGY
jgi:hypothetical protein